MSRPTERAARRARGRVLRSLLPALLAGCRLGTDVPAPAVLSTELAAPIPLARVLTVTLEQPLPLDVEYASADGPRLHVRTTAASRHEVSLTRLRAGRTYHWRIDGTDTEGTFTTEPLPADLAAVRGAATGTPSTPLVMLHLFQPGGFMGYAIIDDAGEVVWFWRTTDFTFGTTRRENGNFVLMDKARGLLEVTPDGRLVHQLAQDQANREMHHDVIVGPSSNTILFIAFDDRNVGGRVIRGDAIWEWTPETGATVRRWTVWDHFTFADAPAPTGGEWLHANSLAIGPRGNILLSAHHWNQVISITPDWQRTEWRLGGANATAPLPAADQFSGQHAAREIGTGRVVLFDNGIARGGYSRAVEYAMDGAAARVAWEWRAQPANFATALGSARRLANGNTLINFGMSAGVAGSTGPTEIYEVGMDGVTRWHLLVNTQLMYRAEPLTSVGAEQMVP